MRPPPSRDEEALAKLLRVGGPKFAGNMVDFFLDFAPTKLAAAMAAERKGNWQGVEDAMHPIGTYANHVGALALRTLVAEIGDLPDFGDRTTVSLRLVALDQAFHEIKPRLVERRAGLGLNAHQG